MYEDDSTEMEILYRGMSLDHDELDQYAEMENKTINLKGFASTSTDKKKALEFAFYNESDKSQTPVLLEIMWPKSLMTQHFKLDSQDFSASFESEQEVLILDGCKMIVKEIIPDQKKSQGLIAGIFKKAKTYTIIRMVKAY